MRARVRLDGAVHDVRLEATADGWVAEVDGERFPVRVRRAGRVADVAAGGAVYTVDASDLGRPLVDGRRPGFEILQLEGVAGVQAEAHGSFGPILPPMTGKVVEMHVAAGDEVAAGDVLFVLEAMKMRNEVRTGADARVTAVHVQAGATVEARQPVLELAPPADA